MPNNGRTRASRTSIPPVDVLESREALLGLLLDHVEDETLDVGVSDLPDAGLRVILALPVAEQLAEVEDRLPVEKQFCDHAPVARMSGHFRFSARKT